MIDEIKDYNLLSLGSPVSTTDSDFVSEIPEDGRTAVVFDENNLGLAMTDSITEIFPDFAVVKVDLVAFAGATDTQISDVLSRKTWRTIYVTADKHNIFQVPSEQRSIVRFTNNSTSTDTKLFSLWCLTQTPGFRDFESWFNKDIRLGVQTVSYISQGMRSKERELYLPHSSSEKYRRWVKTS